MNKTLHNFYRNFYKNTQGYIPSFPLLKHICPGDYFQIVQGNIVTLGNIFRDSLSEDVRFKKNIKLNTVDWQMSDGVTQTYSGKYYTNSENVNLSTSNTTIHKLNFRNQGSFYFHGKNPEASIITNWHEVKEELLLKFTQSKYSFREIYVATEAATVESFTLAIANLPDAEIETLTESDSMSLFGIISHDSTKMTQCKNMYSLEKQKGKKPFFFKAKKLIVKEEKMEHLIEEQIDKSDKYANWEKDFFDYEIEKEHHNNLVFERTKTSLLNYIVNNTLNLSNALDFFEWAPTSLDDLEKLGPEYE